MGLFKGDQLKALKKAGEPLYKTPKSVQETVEILKIAKNGIFEVRPNHFSKTYLFTDINYVTTTQEEQMSIFERYCRLLNSLDVEFKITINNKNKNMEQLRKEVLFADKGDGFDGYRAIYNKIISERIVEGKQGIEQQRYLTVTVERKNFEEAKACFNTLEVNLMQLFREIGSGLIPLDAKERLRILHDYYRLGEEQEFDFDFDAYVKRNADFRNDICNSELKFGPDFIEDEHKAARVLFVKKYPTGLTDRFLNEITSLPAHTMVSIDVVPVPKDVTTAILRKKYLGIESDIIRQQQVRNKHNDFSSDISYTKRKDKQDMEAIMDDVRDNDQCFFLTAVSILITAENKEKLDSLTETVTTIGKRNGCQIAKYSLLQREALNTVLPIGIRQVENMRGLLTQSLAVLMPFTVQELDYAHGFYYGINQVSKNINMGNRKKLINGNGFIFGVPGSGKSFFAKQEMGSVFLNTDDDVIVIDPQNEYFQIAKTFGGAVVNLSSYTENHINPLDVPREATDVNGIIADKGEFMLGICEQCMGESLNARQKSIIDRCIRILYLNLYHNKDADMPTMTDFYNLLLVQKEDEAKDLALSLELFIYGSLNIFTHQTNVDIDNRFLVYGIADLGKELAAISMLVMMENISARIERNAKAGRATWLFVDEFHVLLDREYSAKYLQSLWKKVRKQGGLCTGITQNVVDLLQNYTATTMLANSEFVALLKQAPTDSQKLAKVIDISEAQLKYVVNSPSGMGLIKHGSIVVPFDNRIDHDNDLYKLFSTNLQEKIEEEKEKALPRKEQQ
jgi:ComB4 competence protein